MELPLASPGWNLILCLVDGTSTCVLGWKSSCAIWMELPLIVVEPEPEPEPEQQNWNFFSLAEPERECVPVPDTVPVPELDLDWSCLRNPLAPQGILVS
jgi:hypothetical protein